MSVVKQFKHQTESDDVLITNIQYLMHQQKISEAELSRQTDIPQPTLHKILTGRTSDPRISTLKAIADYFETPLDCLYNEDGVFKTKSLPQGKSIPIISWAECVDSKNPISNLSPNNWEKWIVIEQDDDQQTYGLSTRPSMEPRFPKGTILIVKSSIQPQDGDLVIAHYNGTDEATLRELSVDGPSRLLLSPNHNNEPERLDNTVKIIGTVVQSRYLY